MKGEANEQFKTANKTKLGDLCIYDGIVTTVSVESIDFSVEGNIFMGISWKAFNLAAERKIGKL
jgi:hypothetical protein